MSFDFDELLKAVEQKVQRAQRTYDWKKVIEYIKGHKFVTQKEIARVAGVKHAQLAQQWLNRHTWMVVDLMTREKRVIDPEEFLVKIRQGRNVVYAHREHFEK